MESKAKTEATRNVKRKTRRDGQELDDGKTVENARKEAGMKLDVENASFDHSCGETPECKIPIEKAQPAMLAV